MNWEICREYALWGIKTSSGFASVDRARKGDNLLFWRSKIGFAATALVTEDSRTPQTPNETPWPGGMKTYGIVIPFSNLKEFETPVYLKFHLYKQEITGLSSSALQRGFVPITDKIANQVILLSQGKPSTERK